MPTVDGDGESPPAYEEKQGEYIERLYKARVTKVMNNLFIVTPPC